MAQNRYYSSTALPTTLAAAITSSGATTISVNSITGNPSSFPFTMLIDWGQATQEAVSVTASTGSGPYTLTVTRGVDGTTAQTHVNGAVIVHGVTAEDYNEPQVHIAASSAVHGLSGTVVGTSDTQTLTNKTLGATTFSGGITVSESSATGNVINVTNTHSSPSNANVNLTSAGTSDRVLDVLVSGDTNPRMEVNSSGKVSWSAGGSSAVDTDLYRNAAGELKTDNSITAAANLTVGGSQLLAGGTGVFGVNNAGTPPNSTPSGGAVIYGKSGFVKSRAADGADYGSGSNWSNVAAAGINVTTGTTTLTGLSALLGTAVTYLVQMHLFFLSGTSTDTVNFNFAFSGTASSCSINWRILQQGASNAVTVNTGNNTSITSAMTSPAFPASAAGGTVYSEGIVTASVAGTLTVTGIASAGSNVTVYGGSFLQVMPLA